MALYRKKKQKIWIWRALDCVRNKTIGWCLGNRNIKTFREFFERLNIGNSIFYTDDWEVYRSIIPKDRHVIGKSHKIEIEQSNSNIRHYLARMTRRTKVVSKNEEMIDLSLRITWYLNEAGGYEKYQKLSLSIFWLRLSKILAAKVNLENKVANLYEKYDTQ